MNVVKEIQRINQAELDAGIHGGMSASWHAKYKSAYVYVGGLSEDLNEGDLIVMFSQFGEIVDCNLRRDDKTGKSRGFCFIAYEDQRSTILAVDNMNGIKLLGRTIRVDHSEKFRRPKKKDDDKADGQESDDEDYDERRKRIWDYEKYTPAPILTEAPVNGTSAGAGAAAESAEDKRTKKIMDMLRKRKAKRSFASRDAVGEGKANKWAGPGKVEQGDILDSSGQAVNFSSSAMDQPASKRRRDSAQDKGPAAKKVKKEKKERKDKKDKKDKKEKKEKKDSGSKNDRRDSHRRSRSRSRGRDRDRRRR